MFPPLPVDSSLDKKLRLAVAVLCSAQSFTIMQTAHILCLTTLDQIQVGHAAVSYLE